MLKDFLLNDRLSARSRAKRGDERALSTMLPPSQVQAVLAMFYPEPELAEPSTSPPFFEHVVERTAEMRDLARQPDDPIVRAAERVAQRTRGHAIFGPLPDNYAPRNGA